MTSNDWIAVGLCFLATGLALLPAFAMNLAIALGYSI